MNIQTKINDTKRQNNPFNFVLNGTPYSSPKKLLKRKELAVLAGADISKAFQVFEVSKGIIRRQKSSKIFELDKNFTRWFLVQKGKKCYKYNFLFQQSHWGHSKINESELRYYHNVPDNKDIYMSLITSTEEENGDNIAINMNIKRVIIPRNSAISLKGKSSINLGYFTN